MSGCVVSSVPELDCPLSFVDLCCLFAEETHDKLADIWQQQQQSQQSQQSQPQLSSPIVAPRAQLSHLSNALSVLIAAMQQLQNDVAEWRAEEDEEAEAEEEAEEELDEQRARDALFFQPEVDEQRDSEAETDKENVLPLQHGEVAKEGPLISAAPSSKPPSHYSILASPPYTKPTLRPQQHLAVPTPSFATPASHGRRRRESGISDERYSRAEITPSLSAQLSAYPARLPPTAGESSPHLN